MKTVHDIKAALTQTWDDVLDFPEVSYFDWCAHGNSGDHFIAIASYMYLRDRGIKLRKVSTNRNLEFDGEPIVSQGGGNLGDLFPRFENFRRALIERNHASPIVIMPQSVYFRDPGEAESSRAIYNAHPDLTILVREQASFDIAVSLFDQCKVLLCPDSAWYLCDFVEEVMAARLSEEDTLSRRNLIREDDVESGQQWYRGVYEKFFGCGPRFSLSLAVTLGAMLQLSGCKKLTTRRLHGHILACMMGIPNTIIPVAYHKNVSTFETWTKDLSHAGISFTG